MCWSTRPCEELGKPMREHLKHRSQQLVKRVRQTLDYRAMTRSMLKGAAYKAGTTAVSLIWLWWQNRY